VARDRRPRVRVRRAAPPPRPRPGAFRRRGSLPCSRARQREATTDGPDPPPSANALLCDATPAVGLARSFAPQDMRTARPAHRARRWEGRLKPEFSTVTKHSSNRNPPGTPLSRAAIKRAAVTSQPFTNREALMATIARWPRRTAIRLALLASAAFLST